MHWKITHLKLSLHLTGTDELKVIDISSAKYIFTKCFHWHQFVPSLLRSVFGTYGWCCFLGRYSVWCVLLLVCYPLYLWYHIYGLASCHSGWPETWSVEPWYSVRAHHAQGITPFLTLMLLTHWPLGNLNEILNMTFSNGFLWLMVEASLVKLP